MQIKCVPSDNYSLASHFGRRDQSWGSSRGISGGQNGAGKGGFCAYSFLSVIIIPVKFHIYSSNILGSAKDPLGK
jgi:hypothetical protein